MIAFKSEAQRRLFDAVSFELEALGYRGELLCRNYRFTDWFQPGDLMREAPIAAFGQTPTTHETACLAVALSNGKSGRELISDFRALGTACVFEVHEDRISVWRNSQDLTPQDEQLVISADRIREAFAIHANDWRAESVLRAKEISAESGPRQLDFFDFGLIPALESHIRDKLSHLLNEALSGAARAYGKSLGNMDPEETRRLFRLVFRFLAAKVLHDRGVGEFASLSVSTDAKLILERAGRYYGRTEEVIENPAVLDAIKSILWGRLSFQNLSVEVLAYIYEFTLVSHSLRKRLGIHGTPPSIARYIVRNLPIEDISQDERFILEPCSGHAVFLVAALQRLRRLLPPDVAPAERHQYFVRMLQGFEIDAFALEVSLLCLMLADFPNPNGWRMVRTDIFTSQDFTSALRQARVVLCNPPYEDIPLEKRAEYGNLRSVHKPEEILHRVLDHLHPQGILGFVLPRRVLDDGGYRAIRRRLVERFEDIEIVELPESRVFYVSEHKSALMLAKRPMRGEGRVRLFTSTFEKADQERFLNRYTIERDSPLSLTIDEATKGFAIPALPDVWKVLSQHRKLGEIAEIHHGIAWRAQAPADQRYSDVPGPGFERGYGRADAERLVQYAPPATVFVNIHPLNLRRNAYKKYPWNRVKVIVNAVRISRKARWKHIAFLDDEGLICSENFLGVWPRGSLTTIEILAAILNGPVAAAFVKTHKGAKRNTKEVLKRIPLPRLSDEDRETLCSLVRSYLDSLNRSRNSALDRFGEAENILLQIDGIILKGYDLPPHLERKLLDFFDGSPRPVPFTLTGYDLEKFLPVRILGDADDSAEKWESLKRRRGELIEKEADVGLNEDEQSELERIQKKTGRYFNTIAPLPFDMLEQFEARARRAGIRLDEDEAPRP